MIQNIIPYSGAKFELLPYVFKLIPKIGISKINDIFGGSGCFAINAADTFPHTKIEYNELDHNVFQMVYDLKNYSAVTVATIVKNTIEEFHLTKENEDGYLRAKDHINSIRNVPPSVGIFDIVLTRHAFSSTCRWSKKTGFNMPFGKRTWDFNDMWMDELHQTHDALERVELHNESFIEFMRKHPADKNTLDYIDPPYLITKAVYNHGWEADTDRLLYAMIDQRVESGGRFILSNVTKHKGQINQILIDWMSKYNVLYVNKNYRIGRTSDDSNKTVEVIVTNIPLCNLGTLEDFLY
jgi:DNA adenine methylase Dam